MATRMPQFGSDNLRDLPALLGRLDVVHGLDAHTAELGDTSEIVAQQVHDHEVLGAVLR